MRQVYYRSTGAFSEAASHYFVMTADADSLHAFGALRSVDEPERMCAAANVDREALVGYVRKVMCTACSNTHPLHVVLVCIPLTHARSSAMCGRLSPSSCRRSRPPSSSPACPSRCNLLPPPPSLTFARLL